MTTPQEYFLFRFYMLGEEERAKFLSDNYRIRCLLRTTGEKIFVEQLCDKYNFYKTVSGYFRRSVIVIGREKDKNAELEGFLEFSKKHNDLFVKPLSASYGIGAKVIKIANRDEAIAAYEKLSQAGEWIVEDRIIQSLEMSAWNESSVNTVRLPCFLSSNGDFHVLAPFMRVGRKGFVIDNAGGGGILACVDEKSGIITTNGYDEAGMEYSVHPESKIKFMGWQVPRWQELLELAEEIFRKCLPEHRYIGFDFALTDDGWVVIEGNWGSLSANMQIFMESKMSS